MLTCPCCGYRTFDEPHHGSYDICEVCGWEDDPVQLRRPLTRGANAVSLAEGQRNFRELGTSDPNSRLGGPRNTTAQRDEGWRAFDPSRDAAEQPEGALYWTAG